MAALARWHDAHQIERPRENGQSPVQSSPTRTYEDSTEKGRAAKTAIPTDQCESSTDTVCGGLDRTTGATQWPECDAIIKFEHTSA